MFRAEGDQDAGALHVPRRGHGLDDLVHNLDDAVVGDWNLVGHTVNSTTMLDSLEVGRTCDRAVLRSHCGDVGWCWESSGADEVAKGSVYLVQGEDGKAKNEEVGG